MLSLVEAGQRLDPLMTESSELASLEELKRVFEWQPNRRGRNLLVWLIHNRMLRLFDGEGKAVGVEVTEDARAFFRLYVPKPGRHWRDHAKRNGFDGFDEYDEAGTYLDGQDFGWLLDFLGSEPTLFLDWQLAYQWAGLPMPSARVWGLLQRDPDGIPPQVQQRLAWIRQFSSGRKSEPVPPSSLPSGRSPLFADGWFGDLNLYSIKQFSDFFGQDGFPAVVGGEEGRMTVDPTELITFPVAANRLAERLGITHRELCGSVIDGCLHSYLWDGKRLSSDKILEELSDIAVKKRQAQDYLPTIEARCYFLDKDIDEFDPTRRYIEGKWLLERLQGRVTDPEGYLAQRSEQEEFEWMFGLVPASLFPKAPPEVISLLKLPLEIQLFDRESAERVLRKAGNSGETWTEAVVREKLEQAGQVIRRPHADLPRMVALLEYLHEKGIREKAPDNTKKDCLPELIRRYPALEFTKATLDNAWKPLHKIGLISSVNRGRSERGNWD